MKPELELQRKGFMEKIYVHGSSHGGDYVEFHFFDDRNNYTTKDKCTKAVMRECKYDGTLLYEEWVMIDQVP
jgi:hypothetical protein